MYPAIGLMNKGSLVQTFETDKIKSINPLLPIIEGVFNLHLAAELNAIVDSQYPNKGYNVVLLYDSAKAIMVNSIVQLPPLQFITGFS